jgi:neutral ceramidase
VKKGFYNFSEYNKLMRSIKIIEGKIVPGLVMILSLASCAVVRTPYSKTDYYQKTISRLDSTKSRLPCINDSLFAGFSRVSITPSLFNKVIYAEEGKFNKVPMAGYGERRGKSATGIHDSIFVKAIALKEGRNIFVLVSADLLIMPPNIIDSVTTILSRKGMRRDQIFFSATHSHSSLGGWAYGLVGKQFAGRENKNVEKWLIKQINKAILDAIADLHPAKIGTGSFEASPYTRNRLVGDQGIKNDEFNFIVIEQAGRKKAIIGSFSSHATTLGVRNLQLSADYPGYWERKIEDKTADMAMFCSGSVGSQSPDCPGSEFDCAKYIGDGLADSLITHLNGVRMNNKLILSALSLKIFLPQYHFRLTQKINLTTGLSNRLMELPKNVYLQGLRINNLVWIFTPGDFSGESAVQIKNSLKGKGFETIISSFNGSYVGYIIPGKYFNLNNYETKLMGWFGPTMGDYTIDLINQITNVIIQCK